MYNDITLYHSGHYDLTCNCSFCIHRQNVKRVLEKLKYNVHIEKLECNWDYFYPAKVHFDFALKYQNKIFGEFMFEANTMPTKVIEFANIYFDYIICGSTFLHDVWVNSGVYPKYLLPFNVGIDTQAFCPGKPSKLVDPGIFKFVAVGAWQGNKGWQDRKGLNQLVHLFNINFKHRKEVKLIIKSGKDANMKLSKGNVEIINKNISTKELVNLYRSCAIEGAYIHPHKGEGFGRTLLEALCCGCHIGATNYSGPLTFLNEDNATLFDYEFNNSYLYDASFYPNNQLPVFARARDKEILDWMNYVVATNTKPRIISKETLKHHSWEEGVKKLMQEIERRI